MRLVIVRWLREDTFMMAVRCFIEQTLGAEFLDDACADVEMKDVYSDLDKSTPCLFILSPGADPISTLEHYAREKGIDEDKYHVISLGQGQGPIVEAKLNVHLAKSWLPELQTLLTNIKQEARSGESTKTSGCSLHLSQWHISPFQSFKTALNVHDAPQADECRWERRSLGHLDIKCVNEASSSVWTQFLPRNCARALQFGSLGWNLKYDFSDADFVSAVTLQRRLLDAAANMMAAKGNTNDFPKAEQVMIVLAMLKSRVREALFLNYMRCLGTHCSS
ncbi:Dynein heavy chain [Phytophthora cactorum]|nr:Dynein heavy chain [Phytophthora cactorum]